MREPLVSPEAEDLLKHATELDYMTHLVLRMFENKRWARSTRTTAPRAEQLCSNPCAPMHRSPWRRDRPLLSAVAHGASQDHAENSSGPAMLACCLLHMTGVENIPCSQMLGLRNHHPASSGGLHGGVPCQVQQHDAALLTVHCTTTVLSVSPAQPVRTLQATSSDQSSGAVHPAQHHQHQCCHAERQPAAPSTHPLLPWSMHLCLTVALHLTIGKGLPLQGLTACKYRSPWRSASGCRVPVDSPERFRMEVLFSPGAAYSPYAVVPLHQDHTLPVTQRVCLHQGGSPAVAHSPLHVCKRAPHQGPACDSARPPAAEVCMLRGHTAWGGVCWGPCWRKFFMTLCICL